MTGPKLNERPVLRRRVEAKARPAAVTTSTRATARYVRVSAYKVREVLDLVRGCDVERAREVLQFCERDAAILVGKVLASAVANAEHNDSINPEELYVSACYADEGPTIKRWRPRARGRATRIRKRTCHLTVVVSRLPEEELRKRRAARAPSSGMARRPRPERAAAERQRRVQGARKAEQAEQAGSVAAKASPEPEEAEPQDVERLEIEVEQIEVEQIEGEQIEGMDTDGAREAPEVAAADEEKG